MGITYRTTEYGGAGLPLTNAQVDENFHWLLTHASGALLTDDNNTDVNLYLALTDDSSLHDGALSTAFTSTNKLKFNPSSGTLSSVNFNSLSDARYKTELLKITSSLDKTNSLSGYTFNLIDSNNNRSAGLIAQEVQNVLPEAVGGTEDRLTINYGAVVGLLVEAIKELNEKVEDLTKQLNNK